MRAYQIKNGTLWLFTMQPFKNHSKTMYFPKYSGHVSRRPDWYLKIRSKIWMWFGK